MGQYNSLRLRLAKRLQDEIREKGLQPGDRIDSVRDLASRYKVAPLTVHRMLDLLVQEDVLYQEGKRGTFVKSSLGVKPMIGYLGMIPSPAAPNSLLDPAIEEIFKVFSASHCNPMLISYQEMQSGAVERKLAKLNGLLVSKSFLDQHTIRTLERFPGKIVLVDHVSPEDELAVSQVVPNYIPSLEDFTALYDLSAYDQILFVRAGHSNALETEQECRAFLAKAEYPGNKIRSLELSSKNPEMNAFLHFRETNEDLRNTLLISLSEYYSQGIFHALQDGLNFPDILSFDNMEDYADSESNKESFFTSIDRSFPRIFRTAAELLLRLVVDDDDRLITIKVPTRLVVRHSVSKRKMTFKARATASVS